MLNYIDRNYFKNLNFFKWTCILLGISFPLFQIFMSASHPSWILPLSFFLFSFILATSIGFKNMGLLISYLLAQIYLIWGYLLQPNWNWFFLEIWVNIFSIGCYITIKQFAYKKLQLQIMISKSAEKCNRLQEELTQLRWKKNSTSQKISRFANLHEVAEDLSSTLNFDEIISFIIKHAVDVIGKGDVSIIYILDPNLKILRLTKHFEITEQGHEIHPNPMDRFNRWCLRNQTPILVEDVHEDYRFEIDDESPKLRSLINIPLITDDKFLGILRVASIYPRIFHVDDLRLLSLVSNFAAISIKNSKLYQDTLSLSIRDGLTQLFVSKYFHDQVENSLQEISSNTPLALIMADIDNFKTINDSFGHSVGDNILKLVGQFFLETMGYKNLATRYGGEELSAFFINQDIQMVVDLCENFRKKVEAMRFEFRRKPYQITISIGIISYKGSYVNKDFLIQKADEALYTAKKSGKNKVVLLQ